MTPDRRVHSAKVAAALVGKGLLFGLGFAIPLGILSILGLVQPLASVVQSQPSIFALGVVDVVAIAILFLALVGLLPYAPGRV